MWNPTPDIIIIIILMELTLQLHIHTLHIQNKKIIPNFYASVFQFVSIIISIIIQHIKAKSKVFRCHLVITQCGIARILVH